MPLKQPRANGSKSCGPKLENMFSPISPDDDAHIASGECAGALERAKQHQRERNGGIRSAAVRDGKLEVDEIPPPETFSEAGSPRLSVSTLAVPRAGSF